jgi:hypothetical protein
VPGEGEEKTPEHVDPRETSGETSAPFAAAVVASARTTNASRKEECRLFTLIDCLASEKIFRCVEAHGCLDGFSLEIEEVNFHQATNLALLRRGRFHGDADEWVQ